MRTLLILSLLLLMTACSNPKDIVFGPDPLKEMAEKGDEFKKLPEEDRVTLAGYLAAVEIGKVFNKEVKPVTGRTVGEVLVDAKAWKEEVKARELAQKADEQKAEELARKVEAERKAISDQIAKSAIVAVVGSKRLPENYDVGRYSEMLVITYAVQNKSNLAIRQIKGFVTFKDMTGDEIGVVYANIDQTIPPGKTIQTDTGRGLQLNEFMNEDKERIAGRKFSDMKATFEAESIAFSDGTVIKAPDATE